ncbi:MAG: hypothetical protein H7A36_06165 [Chlamydiales bacterium]|nr:hypothetical protein [Chlamydiales bacterium]
MLGFQSFEPGFHGSQAPADYLQEMAVNSFTMLPIQGKWFLLIRTGSAEGICHEVPQHEGGPLFCEAFGGSVTLYGENRTRIIDIYRPSQFGIAQNRILSRIIAQLPKTNF